LDVPYGRCSRIQPPTLAVMHGYLAILIVITLGCAAVFLYLNRKRRIFWLIFVALVLISIVVDVSTFKRYPASPKTKTRAIINSVRFGIIQVEGRTGRSIEQSVPHTTNLNESITFLLLRNGLIDRHLVSSNSLICINDAWGAPLQMIFKSDLNLKTNDFPRFRNNTNPVFIWSMGPNGINEYGKGDDVVME
jgi:hypothetical protein